MSIPLVEVVVVNWKRSGNLQPILARFREQTIPVLLTLIDVHPAPEFALAESTLRLADRSFRWTENYGAFNRYVPSFGYRCPYTYFHDDDMLPGRRVAEYFLACARHLPSFGVLGQFGRRLQNGIYTWNEVRPDNSFIEVDNVVRSYFIRTANLVHLFRLLWERTAEFQGSLLRDDDLLLCLSMGLYGNLACYVVPLHPDPETRVNSAELDDRFALCTEPGHLERRQHFYNWMAGLGWKSVEERMKAQQTALANKTPLVIQVSS